MSFLWRSLTVFVVCPDRVPVVANYIPVRCKNEGVFQYAVSFSPQVDSRNMTFKLLYQHTDVIGETKAFDGAILFLSKKLPAVSILRSRPSSLLLEVTIVMLFSEV